jgi:hypothetical protein
MSDTADIDAALDRLIEASIASAGPYLRESFELPEHAFGSTQLRALFARKRAVALATVTARGEPRVAPIDAFLYGTAFCMPTLAHAARARQLARNSASSLTCFEHEWAVLAHGISTIVAANDDDFAALDRSAREAGMPSVLDWGEGVYVRFEPRTLITWTRELPGPGG